MDRFSPKGIIRPSCSFWISIPNESTSMCILRKKKSGLRKQKRFISWFDTACATRLVRWNGSWCSVWRIRGFANCRPLVISMAETDRADRLRQLVVRALVDPSGHAAHHGSELQDNRGRNSMFAQEATASYATSAPDIVPFGQILRTYLVAQVGKNCK